MSYSFHPAAQAEHLENVSYYERQHPGLGALYLTDFTFTMDAVCSAPQRYLVVDAPIRQARLKRFPFHVLYRFEQDDVLILAIAHYRRKPNYWKERKA